MTPKTFEYELLGAESKERRPGITELAKRIKQAHPTWPLNRVAAEAKIRWHEQHSKEHRHG